MVMKATKNSTNVEMYADIILMDTDVDAMTVDVDADAEVAVVTDGVT